MSDFNFFLNRQGPRGAQGVKGDTGFSPTIAPSADNDGLTVYKLVITNENNTYETENLMGNLNTVDDGGTYLRYNRETGAVSASEADTATASAAGVVRLATSTDYANLADDAVMSPSSFVDNYSSIFAAGSGIQLSQNVDDKIVIAIDDSTVVTETDLTSALANYVTSSNLSSTLTNYVTNTSLSTTLSSYATQSWVENKNYVINLSNKASSLAIGSSASVGAVNSVAIGYGAQTNSAGSIAIGSGAATSWGYSIQLGAGTNISSGTFGVGFGALGNYTLLDGNTGLIPDARLSSDIARTSDIPTIATSVSSSSTNAETVGAKLFYDTCGDIESLINSL